MLNTLRQKLIQSYIKTEIKNDNNENNYFKTNSFLLNKKKLDFILINRKSYVYI
jgi:hypothetical protein